MLFFSAGFFHWFLQRCTAIFLFFLVLSFFFLNLKILYVSFFIFLGIHLKLGIENLINDYCHDKILKLLGVMQLRLFFLYILRFLILSF
jgi:succinate dehydrogenase hydrophobic anchor subunit